MSKPIISDGTLIDNRYLIQKVLGQAGLGRTYLAFDTRRFNEACVLKEFVPSGSGKHSFQKSRALFKREAEILYRVQHPQIPNFLACFEGDEGLFLVQEYVNGQTYSDLLKARRKQESVFSEQEVIAWLNHLLPVLDYVHQRSIIHRYISPDSIMLPSNSNLPVLVDFGVGKQIVEAAQLDDETEEISYVGKMSLVGKAGYAPHEQIRLGVCSTSSDLYALGVTAVVLLTCKDPSTLMNQYSLKWEWRSYADVSPAFGQILNRMLADTPINRYQSVLEVSYDLAQLAPAAETALSVLAFEPTPTSATPYTSPTIVSLGLETEMPAPSRPQASELPRSNPPLPRTPPVTSSSVNTSFPGNTGLSPAFIQQCQRQLTEYIGPMAPLIVNEMISNEQPTTAARLVELLIPEIPSQQEALAFRQQLLG